MQLPHRRRSVRTRREEGYMTFVSRLAVAAAFTFAAPVAIATLSTPAMAQAMSPAVGNALKEAQKLAAAGNVAAATARINVARSAASSPAERKKVAEMSAYVNTRAGRYGAAAQELEAAGATPGQLAPLYYRAGQYDKAISLGNRMGGVDGKTIVAQSYIKKGDYEGAARIYNGLIKANGPREQWLENLAAAQFKMGDKKAYMATTERLIRIDPSPRRWRTLLIDLKNANMPRDAKLGLYQLMRETGNVTKPEDYADFAKLAIVAGQPGVAKQVLDAARSANAVAASDPTTSKLVEAAGKRAIAAQAELPKLPRTGVGQLTAGNTYMGMNDYAKASAAYNAAINAGGIDANSTRLLLGISQLRAGQKAAAQATFKSIPTTAAGVSDVAGLWYLYTSTR